MKSFLKVVVISILSAGLAGCTGNSTEKDAAEARTVAADARASAVEADARVTAADAHVRAAEAAVDAADADARVAATKETAVKLSGKLSGTKVVIPSGTLLKVSLLDAVDSDTSSTGDHFLASLSEDVVRDGVTFLQKGTKFRGRVVGVEEAGRVKGRATISLALTDIVLGERMIPITTGILSASADSTEKRDAGVIAGGAGVGAVIGAIAGGKKGAAIGGATGGGAGTGVILATRGKGIHYGPETRLNFTLSNPVQL